MSTPQEREETHIKRPVHNDKDTLTLLIKIMLKRRKESDTYLAADRRHRRSTQMTIKVDKLLKLWLSSAEEDFLYFHCDLSAPAMPTDSSHVGVAIFPSF